MIDKIKYDYILYAWEKEIKRDDKIEDKAKFIFSVLIILLCGVVFKYDLIAQIVIAAKSNSITFLYIIFTILTLIGLSVLFSLYFICKTITVKGYRPIFPLNTLESLYDRDSNFFDDNSEEQFYDSMGKYITSSFEYNVGIIEKKAKNIKIAWSSLIVSTILTFILFILWITLNMK